MTPGVQSAVRPAAGDSGRLCLSISRDRRRPIWLAALGAGLALLLPSASHGQTGGYGGYPPVQPPAYHIGVTPSGVPYVVSPGQSGGQGYVVWPYQEQPLPLQAAPSPGQAGFQQALPTLPQPPAVAAPRAEPVATPPAAPSVAPAPAPPPSPPPREVAPTPLPEVRPVEPEEEPGELVYEDGVYAIDKDYLLSWGLNPYRFFTAPLRFDETDWLIAAGVAGTVGALFLADEVLVDFWQDNIRGSFTNDAADVFRPLGEFNNLLYGTLGAYGVAEVLDSTGAIDARREKAAALMSAQSLVLTALLTQGSKYITGRKRPADTDDRFDFNGPGDFDTNDSFWSGHASEVFAVASVISEVYAEDEPWVPYVAYTLAGGTALSRVNDDRHWFSDIAVGAAAGYFIGKLVTRFNPFLADQGIGVEPLVQEGGQGLNFTYNF